MKILLTGSTGRVGQEVLRACLEDPSVTSLIVLSRRPLEGQHPKITTIIHRDFSSYTDEILNEALSCDGAIWCLGVLSRMSISVEERVRITRGSVIAFLEAFVPKLEAAGTRDKPWRLVWLGGMIMVRDQQASIWLLPGMRKSAGQIQNDIAVYADGKVKTLEIYFSNLGPNYAQGASWFTGLRRSLMWAIELKEHGYALISLVESGSKEQDLWNSQMIEIASDYRQKKGVVDQ